MSFGRGRSSFYGWNPRESLCSTILFRVVRGFKSGVALRQQSKTSSVGCLSRLAIIESPLPVSSSWQNYRRECTSFFCANDRSSLCDQSSSRARDLNLICRDALDPSNSRKSMATSLRALIIEDSENDCLLLLSTLQRGGYVVDHKRVDTAIGLKSTLDDPWDIVISDFSMPGFRGTDALAIVRERGLDTPFIFLSGTIGEEMAVNAMKAGARTTSSKATSPAFCRRSNASCAKPAPAAKKTSRASPAAARKIRSPRQTCRRRRSRLQQRHRRHHGLGGNRR